MAYITTDSHTDCNLSYLNINLHIAQMEQKPGESNIQVWIHFTTHFVEMSINTHSIEGQANTARL